MATYQLETAWTISSAPPAGNLAVQVRDNTGSVVAGVVVDTVISRGGPTYTALVSGIPDTMVGYAQLVNTVTGQPVTIRGIAPSDAPAPAATPGGVACDTLLCDVPAALSAIYAGGGDPQNLADFVHAICNGRCAGLSGGGGGGGGGCCSTAVPTHCTQQCVTNAMGVALPGVTVEMYTDPARVNRVAFGTTDVDGNALLCALTGGTYYIFKTLAGYSFANPTVVTVS